MDAKNLIEAFQSANNLARTTGNAKESLESYSDFIQNCHLYLNGSADKIGHSDKSQITELLAEAYNNRGFVKYLQVDFEEAVEDYSKALSFNESMYYSYYNRGLIHYRLARFHEAIQDMEKALQLKPDFEPAQKCLQQSSIDREIKRTS